MTFKRFLVQIPFWDLNRIHRPNCVVHLVLKVGPIVGARVVAAGLSSIGAMATSPMADVIRVWQG